MARAKNKTPDSQLSFLDLLTTSAASPVAPAPKQNTPQAAQNTANINTPIAVVATTVQAQKAPAVQPAPQPVQPTYTPPQEPSIAHAIPDYRLPETGRKLSQTWLERAMDNIAAIKLARALEKEKRRPNKDEQDALARFIAFSASALSEKVFPVPGAVVDEKWQNVINLLSAETTEKERESLARSTQYAHFTPEPVIQAIWKFTTDSLNFNGGRVLEPGCGPGLFIALVPQSLVGKARFTGVELDPLTALISKNLYPNQNIVHADFTKWKSNGDYDLAIGNPPFSARTLPGPDELSKNRLSLHTFFIARAMLSLKKGSYGIFICSRYLMDSQTKAQREALSQICAFRGAVRLPSGGMKYGNDTEVVADILIFQKDTDVQSPDWINTKRCDTGSELALRKPEAEYINEWFINNPQTILGKSDLTTSPFGPTYTCVDVNKILPSRTNGIDALRSAVLKALESIIPPAHKTEKQAQDHHKKTSQDVNPQSTSTTLDYSDLVDATPLTTSEEDATSQPTIQDPLAPIKNMLEEIKDFEAPNPKSEELLLENEREKASFQVGRAADGATLKENSYLIIQNQLHQIVNHYPVPVTIASKDVRGMTKKDEKIVRALIPIRDLVREIIRVQSIAHENADSSAWSHLQAKLKHHWQKFVDKFLPINHQRVSTRTNPTTGKEIITVRHPNLSAFSDDPDTHLVASIEKYDPDTDSAEPGAIFSQRILYPEKIPQIETALDAVSVCLNSIGKFDLDTVCSLAKKDRETIIAELGDTIYPDINDPTGTTWALAEEILSGNVREKHTIAKSLASDNPIFSKVAEILENTIPKDLTPSEITMRPGASWIPPKILERFCKEIMGVETEISFIEATETWCLKPEKFLRSADARTKWGTGRRHAGLIFLDLLNSQVPQIYDTVINEKGNRTQVLNQEATEAAKECLNRIQNAFNGWIWTDAERSEELLGIYNHMFNSVVPRTFDGSHLTFPGQSTEITLRPLQKNAVWRIIATGNTYLYHCVGSGKTFTIASAVMEQQRLGLINRPIIVVPNHCLAQFAADFMRLYPKANILVADETHFSKEKRQRFIARMTLNKQDAILISHDAFKLIPAPSAFEMSMIEDEISKIELVLSENDNLGMSRKSLEAKKEKLYDHIKKLTEHPKDDMLCFSETGIDQIIADEAHIYRKLSFATRQTTLKGVDPNGSQRSWDMFVKIRYLDTTSQSKRSKILATGTAITNTIGEFYTVFRYMDIETLERQKTASFDAWLSVYGESKTELELQPSGLYKPVTRLMEFVNMADLMASFRNFADIIQKSDLATQVDLPQIKTGKRQIIVSKPSENFQKYKETLASRIRAIEARGGRPEKGDDIILKVIGDGRHAAIDLRLVGFGINETENKLNEMIQNVFRIWSDNRYNVYTNPKTGKPYPRTGAAQMIFSDLGTESVAATRGFSAYTWVRQELIRMGIPAEEIVFMQDYKTSSARAQIFTSVNEGRISVLLGSTQTMGTGANAQQRLIALHHLDVPWLVADLIQREGRIERQGNQNDVIDIYAYATRGSVDATSWQRLEQKARFINMAFSGDRSIRRIADIGDDTTQFAHAKALASGDPKLMRKGLIENELARLNRLLAAHLDRSHLIKSKVLNATKNISSLTRKLEGIREMAEIEEKSDPQTSLVLTNGTQYGADTESLKDAGARLSGIILQEVAKPPTTTSRTIKIGTWHDINIECTIFVAFGSNTPTCTVSLVHNNIEIETTIKPKSYPGHITKALNSAIEQIPGLIEKTESRLLDNQHALKEYSRIDANQPFAQQDELDSLQDELDQIETALEAESREKDARAKEAEKLEAEKKAEQDAKKKEDSANTTTI